MSVDWVLTAMVASLSCIALRLIIFTTNYFRCRRGGVTPWRRPNSLAPDTTPPPQIDLYDINGQLGHSNLLA